MSASLNEEEAVEKVLRRAEISRITRHLKSRLALASFKAKRGWEDLALDSLEQELTSSTSSSGSNNNNNINSINGSGNAGNTAIPADTGSKYTSPDKAAFFYTNFSSPNHHSSRDMLEPPVELTRKRARTVSGPMAKPPVPPSPASVARAGRAAANIQINGSSNGSEPASASSNTRHGREMSSPDPPKTPPRTDKDGANLLMYLATSPSPAQRTTFGSNRLPRTPQQSFNFADYLNIVTPSPAAGHGSPINTPRGARRRLFED